MFRLQCARCKSIYIRRRERICDKQESVRSFIHVLYSVVWKAEQKKIHYKVVRTICYDLAAFGVKV